MRKLFLLFIIFLLILGCGKKDKSDVVFWQFFRKSDIDPMIVKFEEDTGFKIKTDQLTWQNGLEKITLAFASKKVPDLLELGSTWVTRFAEREVLRDITEDVKPFKDEFIFWEPATYKGRIYGVPWVLGSRVLFYNKDLFMKAGLDPDRPPKTWNDLLKAAMKINDLGSDIYGFGIGAGEKHILYKKFLPFVWSNGGKIFNKEMNECILNSPQTKKALEFYLRLAKYGLREKQDILDKTFKMGKLGMQISGAWNLERIPKEVPKLNFGVALIPVPKAGMKSVSFSGGEILVFPKRSNNFNKAFKLARYLIKEKQVLVLTSKLKSVFPATKEAEKDIYFRNYPKQKVFIKQNKTSKHPPSHPKWTEIQDIISKLIEHSLAGKNIDILLKNTQEDINRLISSK